MRASVLLSEAAKDLTCVSEAKELGGALDLDDNLLDRSGPVTDGMIGDPEAYAGRVVVGDVSRRWICGADYQERGGSDEHGACSLRVLGSPSPGGGR